MQELVRVCVCSSVLPPDLLCLLFASPALHSHLSRWIHQQLRREAKSFLLVILYVWNMIVLYSNFQEMTLICDGGYFLPVILKNISVDFFPQALRYFRTSQTIFFLPCADVAGLCPGSNVYTAQTDLLHWRRETFRWTVGGLLFTLVILHPYFIFSYCAASVPFRDLFIFCEFFFFFSFSRMIKPLMLLGCLSVLLNDQNTDLSPFHMIRLRCTWEMIRLWVSAD